MSDKTLFLSMRITIGTDEYVYRDNGEHEETHSTQIEVPREFIEDATALLSSAAAKIALAKLDAAIAAANEKESEEGAE